MKRSDAIPPLPRASILAPVLCFALLFVACSDGGVQNNDAATGSQNDNQAKVDQTGAGERPAIVFLGDSLTAGRGLAASESAPALIESKLADANLNYEVINAGRSGDTTAGGLARLPWYLEPEVRPRVLVIGLGSNDAMRGLPLAEIEANLRKIVAAARAYNPDMQIFLYQMHTFPNMGPQYAKDYERLFAKVAKSETIILLPFPLLGVAGKSELNQPDGIHPTAEGTRIMADNIWKALEPHLKRI
ncbi:MAG: arylesterase [Leptospirales bacterium]|jgi:acyl-CoA thioesterase-1